MRSSYKEFVMYALIFIATFGVAFFIFGMSYIPTASMEPTLSVGHKYPYFKLHYLFTDPERGDIIIYDREGTVYCKRIIGTPGDHIELLDGTVRINGEVIDEPYAHGNTYPFLNYEYLVPEGEFFVLGDNRENSRDSRFWDYPYITKNQILGELIDIKK